jgi:hypothetical protein
VYAQYQYGDLVRLETELDAEGAPWTPSRLPEWPVNRD